MVRNKEIDNFFEEREHAIKLYTNDEDWKQVSNLWLKRAFEQKYMYNFTALGRPIIQIPTDMVVMQELIWLTQPDLIIETGIAHGGSLILSASMLALLDMSDAIKNGLSSINPGESQRKVIGIDIDIRSHNREAIEAHPMASRIEMIQGSSTDPEIIDQVQHIASRYKRVFVCLDSNHTHDHVLAELEAYAHLTSIGSYCLVFDTIIEDMPIDFFRNRPWNQGNSPKTAVWKYLETHSEFEIDNNIQNKLLITAAPDGIIKRVY